MKNHQKTTKNKNGTTCDYRLPSLQMKEKNKIFLLIRVLFSVQARKRIHLIQQVFRPSNITARPGHRLF